MRERAGLSVARFCGIAGVHRATYHRWALRERAGRPGRGGWPAPVRDGVEQAAAQLALEWPAWGHRKIWALLQADGFHASQATVRRALRARALLQPPATGRERRALARSRRAAFSTPPARRNRVWQTDFSEHETTGAGVWQLGGVVDYVAKLCLSCPVSATKTWRDAVCVLECARERACELLGYPLLDDLTDPQTGEVIPIIVVSDNGACYRASGFARHIAARPEFRHVRTRYRAPETNGVIERWFESLKYEHLYRHEIDDGPGLAAEVERYLAIYNENRPHEALDFKLPIDRYLRPPPIVLKPAIQLGPCGRVPL
jgi:putative transposase